MQRFIKLSAVMAAVIAAPAFAAATMDANLELDTKYGNQSRGMSQGGRVEFNVAGKAGDDNGFIAGRGTLLLQKTGGAATDDMWGQIGTKTADVKFGRFEAADLYPAGKDVYVEEGGSGALGTTGLGHARTNELRGRVSSDAAHLALTVNAGAASFELGVIESKTAASAKGVRPAVSFNAGPVSVKLGLESGNVTSLPGATKFSGFGGTVGFGVAGGTVNLNLASRTDKVAGGDEKHTSVGLVGVFGPAGIAVISDKDVGVKQTTAYVAYSIPVFNTGATVTPAASYSKRTSGQSFTGAAVRVNYAF